MTTTLQKTDNWGRVVLTEEGLLEMFYQGHFQVPDVLAEHTDLIATYNNWCKHFNAPDKQVEQYSELDISPEEYHAQRQAEWLMPEEYQSLDMRQWLLDRCQSTPEVHRVEAEIKLFRKYAMEDVLRFLVYMTSTLRQAGVWWGVGRGSSVASYCLFLIGVHKVDSIAYDLDIGEFIRE